MTHIEFDNPKHRYAGLAKRTLRYLLDGPLKPESYQADSFVNSDRRITVEFKTVKDKEVKSVLYTHRNNGFRGGNTMYISSFYLYLNDFLNEEDLIKTIIFETARMKFQLEQKPETMDMDVLNKERQEEIKQHNKKIAAQRAAMTDEELTQEYEKLPDVKYARGKVDEIFNAMSGEKKPVVEPVVEGHIRQTKDKALSESEQDRQNKIETANITNKGVEKAALITAGAIILAAIISGIFGLLSSACS